MTAKSGTITDSDGIHRVLVCDDERHIVRLIQVNLERQGYEVRTAFTGAEALSKLAHERFDLAVIDSRLPDMTGRQVIQSIRSNPDTANIRIVLMGEKDDWGDDDERGHGPDMFISKPFNPLQLVGR